MAKAKVRVTVFNDAVIVRGRNKQVLVKKQNKEGKKKFLADNVIHLKSLTSEVGPHAGVSFELSDNGKVKYSHIGLSDEAIRELYVALHHYIKKDNEKKTF